MNWTSEKSTLKAKQITKRQENLVDIKGTIAKCLRHINHLVWQRKVNISPHRLKQAIKCSSTNGFLELHARNE